MLDGHAVSRYANPSDFRSVATLTQLRTSMGLHNEGIRIRDL